MHGIDGAASRGLRRLSALALALFLATGCPGEEEPQPTPAGAVTVQGQVTYDFVPATYCYTATRRLAAPFAILDSMYTASRAFLAVRPVTLPPLKVSWSPNNVPQEGDPALGFITTSRFSARENKIYILGKAGADTDEFDSHVIVHEWGHFFEQSLSRADSPGGFHGAGDMLDPRVAFGEGYGNALAAMLLPESIYADTAWLGPGGTLSASGFDAETEPSPTDDPHPGPFSEMSIQRLLYDLYDSGTSEAHDRMTVDLGTLYDVLVGPQKTTEAMTTIGSFVAGLKDQPGVDTAAVDALLAHYEIGPITTPWGDGDSKLSDMYTPVSLLPYAGSANLDGGYEFNKRQQNQYFVFSGSGDRVTVSATSDDDVSIAVYHKGAWVAGADQSLSGTETFDFHAQTGRRYVVVLTGFKSSPGGYPVSVSITSP
ncbi:hypothetical protein [Cystobacter ferrugineus]|uniref:Uncharacterized protein n=1 Tax=Cystobacter ferrugineus TaxID=83449 RepID=A0A1L9BGH0_9BACT|nr:hypothetical protein [Cystobacter ferrugineus]OJH41325.1 hypothetical protein BON30_10675 [Cystobacter ferrugineus]